MAKKQPREYYRLFIETATLLVICFYTYYARQQSIEMLKATDAAKTSAGAAQRAATIAENTFNQNKDFAGHTLEQMNRQTEAMQDSANSTKEALAQNKKVLDTTVQQFRLEQRAWVGFVSALPPEYKEGDKDVYVKDGQPLRAGVSIINSGKTPALNVHAVAAMSYWKSDDEFTPVYKIANMLGGPSTSVIQPDNTISITTPSFPEKGGINKADVDNIISGRWTVYISGYITYDDVFREHHRTKFCCFLDRGLRSFHNFKNYNEAN